MPVLTNVVLQDRQPTPANHTFVPVDRIDGGVGILENKGATYLENKRCTVSYRKTPGERLKLVEKLAIPVVVNETINGVTVPKVARVAYAEIRLDFSVSATEQERKDLVGMTMSSLDATKLFSLMAEKAETARS